MNCSAKRPAGWLIATPLFPFFIAAWAGGAVRRKAGAAENRDCGADRQRPTAAGHRTGRDQPAADLVDTAVASGGFETLVKALHAADLVDTLKSEGPFTVFAPVDAAFARLPEGTLDELLADKERLASLLSFHVVAGRVEAAALDSYAAMKTVQGKSLDVDTSIGVRVGPAYVVQADIETSNGVIHAIDSVLVPE